MSSNPWYLVLCPFLQKKVMGKPLPSLLTNESSSQNPHVSFFSRVVKGGYHLTHQLTSWWRQVKWPRFLISVHWNLLTFTCQNCWIPLPAWSLLGATLMKDSLTLVYGHFMHFNSTYHFGWFPSFSLSLYYAFMDHINYWELTQIMKCPLRCPILSMTMTTSDDLSSSRMESGKGWQTALFTLSRF